MLEKHQWNSDEVYNTQCVLWYIIFFLHKRNDYSPIAFSELVWIISRANCEMFEKHCRCCVNPDLFVLFDFDCDITPHNFKPKKLSMGKWLGHISDEQKSAIENAYTKWIIYGKIITKIKSFLKRNKK